MKFFTVAAVALSAAVANAQGSSGQDVINMLPQCSLPCFAYSIPMTGCGLTDFACTCKQANIDKISNDVTQCVIKQCQNLQDDLKVLNVVNGVCKNNGGAQIPIPSLPPGFNGTTPGGKDGPGLAGLTGGSGASTSSSQSITPGPRATYFTAAAPAQAQPTNRAQYFIAAAGALGALAL